MSESNTAALFAVGSRVELVERGEIIDVATVVRDRRTEITLKSERYDPGTETDFAYIAESDTWKMLFDDLAGQRCTSTSGPHYVIRAVTNTEVS